MGTPGDSDATGDEDLFTMVFESLQNDTAGDDANFDIITINIITDNNAKDVWKGLTEAFVLSKDVFLISWTESSSFFAESQSQRPARRFQTLALA